MDGVLTKAIEAGQWVLLDNANLCSATVLDRLNPLLEPDGVLLLNEAGTSNGQSRTLRPHPNFRLILAQDPRQDPSTCADPSIKSGTLSKKQMSGSILFLTSWPRGEERLVLIQRSWILLCSYPAC